MFAAFYYRKKSGIPKISNSGLADFVLGGKGLTATVHIEEKFTTSCARRLSIP